MRILKFLGVWAVIILFVLSGANYPIIFPLTLIGIAVIIFSLMLWDLVK